MSDAQKMLLDNLANKPIVKETQLHKETPSAGACNTNRGLTSQAEHDSMEATQNPISAIVSRQLLSQAVDDSFDREVEYCPPPETVLDDFAWHVCRTLGDELSQEFFTVETRHGFRQFLNIVIGIETKRANRSGCEQDQNIQGQN